MVKTIINKTLILNCMETLLTAKDTLNTYAEDDLKASKEEGTGTYYEPYSMIAPAITRIDIMLDALKHELDQVNRKGVIIQ